MTLGLQPREQPELSACGVLFAVVWGEGGSKTAANPEVQLRSSHTGAVDQSSNPQDGGFTSTLSQGSGLVPGSRKRR